LSPAIKIKAARESSIQASRQQDSRTRILEAALQVIRTKGYNACRIEDVCAAAGLTKGGFFHHFKSKEEMAVAAVDFWVEITGALFRSAPYHEPSDPVDRLLAYVDFRKALLQGELPQYTCLVGTMTQEIYITHPGIREAANRSIVGHAKTLVSDVEAAMLERRVRGDWTAESLALYTQATIQGAFILAKAGGGVAVASACMDHLRRYLELLFVPCQKPITLSLEVV
jgi:TetR/AcrR family transcriptional repressor of nem operon